MLEQVVALDAQVIPARRQDARGELVGQARLHLVRVDGRRLQDDVAGRVDASDDRDRLAVLNEGNLVALGTPAELKSEIGGDVILLDAARDASLLADRIRALFNVQTTVLENQVRIEREEGHRFVTDVVEAFPGEIQAISISKPALEDVFIRRTGHKFWSEGKPE